MTNSLSNTGSNFSPGQGVGNTDDIRDQLAKRFLAAQRNSQNGVVGRVDNASVGQGSVIKFYKTNRDGTIVAEDAEGRTLALADSKGNPIQTFEYKDKTSQEPASITLADGTVLTRMQVPGQAGKRTTVWQLKRAEPPCNEEFHDGELTINRDGTFAIRYRKTGMSVQEHQVSFTASGIKRARLERISVMRVGPNSISAKDSFVKRPF